ncbi:MAG: TadE/TadG family type IV pilus assembly protein, partial [Myxococcaceae bacterium]
MKRTVRGQAMVELVLGLLIFVTVLIAGIHFGELSHLSLKAHEASASAAWDATSYRAEQLGPEGVDSSAWYDASKYAVPNANSKGGARYDNWDGRSSSLGKSPPVGLYTRPADMVTSCQNVTGSPLDFRTQDTTVTPAFGSPGVVTCASAGIVTTINIPQGFLDKSDNGYFKAKHLNYKPITLCGLGRSNNGQCGGAVALVLGDHGLTTGNGENAECPRYKEDDGVMGSACANAPFYRLAHENWDRSFGWTPLPDQWTKKVAGTYPKGKVTGFYMSFRGEESGFGEIDTRLWQSTPMDYAPAGTYRTAYNQMYTRDSGDSLRFLYAGRYRCD